MNDSLGWIPVCTLSDLPLERGVPALVAGEQVALFRLSPTEVVAVQHRDPYSGANVLARGLIGSRDIGVLGPMVTLSSPLHKQIWDVRTGECLDAGGADPRPLRAWSVRVDGELVLVARPAVAASVALEEVAPAQAPPARVTSTDHDDRPARDGALVPQPA
jgi:nitrite reductase (NADH) small subunit